jgi:hypothetical protein
LGIIKLKSKLFTEDWLCYGFLPNCPVLEANFLLLDFLKVLIDMTRAILINKLQLGEGSAKRANATFPPLNETKFKKWLLMSDLEIMTKR